MKASRLIRTYVAQGVTEAMAWEVSCRRCGAAGGFPCCSPTGLVVMKPHLDRYKQAAKAMEGAAGSRGAKKGPSAVCMSRGSNMEVAGSSLRRVNEPLKTPFRPCVSQHRDERLSLAGAA